VQNWFQLEETGEVKHVLKDSVKMRKVYLPVLNKRSKDIYEEYFSKHVLKGKYLQYLKLKKKWAILIAQSIEHNDRSLEMRADMINAEIEKKFPQLKNKKELSNMEAFFNLESFLDLGFMDPKKITLDEYMNRVEDSNKRAKKMKSELDKVKKNG